MTEDDLNWLRLAMTGKDVQQGEGLYTEYFNNDIQDYMYMKASQQ